MSLLSYKQRVIIYEVRFPIKLMVKKVRFLVKLKVNKVRFPEVTRPRIVILIFW